MSLNKAWQWAIRICNLHVAVQSTVHCWLSFQSTIYLLYFKYNILIMGLLQANICFSHNNKKGVAVFSGKFNPCQGYPRGLKPELCFMEKTFRRQEVLQHQGTLQNRDGLKGNIQELPGLSVHEKLFLTCIQTQHKPQALLSLGAVLV